VSGRRTATFVDESSGDPSYLVSAAFAGAGRDRHYLALVEPLAIPNVCVVGNHDLDDPGGRDAWAGIHGPTDFTFACGHTRFVAIDAAPGAVGEIDIPEGDDEGPRADALAFLDATLAAADEPYRVVLMHMPPHLGGFLAPHEEWGFKRREDEFLAILRRHGVGLVCCAHGLAFTHRVNDGIHFVMSGGGGTGLCSHLHGICTPGDGDPEDRGALFHAVRFTIDGSGAIGGRVLQAFDPDPQHARISLGET
jgi:hypothetical protein